MNYFYLAIAIITEVLGTSCLKSCQAFTKPIPSLVVLIGYFLSFYFLSLSLRTIPIGVAYAIWSGLGMVILTFIGYSVFKQKLDAPALFGISCIIIGVLVLNFFSKTAS